MLRSLDLSRGRTLTQENFHALTSSLLSLTAQQVRDERRRQAPLVRAAARTMRRCTHQEFHALLGLWADARPFFTDYAEVE